jgi:general secretion pathway protein M
MNSHWDNPQENPWLTGRRGRALALIMLLLACATVWACIINPLLSWYQSDAALLQQQTVLAARMEQAAVTLPALRRQAEISAGRPAAANATLPSTSDAVAGAMLQERVEAMATEAGAILTSVETLPAEPAGAWRRIGLRVALTAPWAVLIRLLEALDLASTPMLADDLHVHTSPIDARQPPTLPVQASFTVIAFRAAAPGEAHPSIPIRPQ